MAEVIDSMQLSNDAYADLMALDAQDSRLGDQDFLVTEKILDAWDDGRPRFKAKGVLPSANNSRFDITWSPIPADFGDEIARRKAKQTPAWEDKKFKSVTANAKFERQMREFYGYPSPTDIPEGAIIRVKVVKNKKGYLALAALLPKSGSTSGAGASPAPF